MNYTYTTTKEMDEALAYNAAKQGQTAVELFNNIVTSDMKTLVSNMEGMEKDRVYEAYKKAAPTDKAMFDVIAVEPK